MLLNTERFHHCESCVWQLFATKVGTCSWPRAENINLQPWEYAVLGRNKLNPDNVGLNVLKGLRNNLCAGNVLNVG